MAYPHDLIIDATFVGADLSHGYRKGQKYRLRLSSDTISRMLDGGGECPYSVQGFFINWTDIVVVGPTPRLQRTRI